MKETTPRLRTARVFIDDDDFSIIDDVVDVIEVGIDIDVAGETDGEVVVHEL